VLPASARATADWLATPGRPLHGQLDRVAHHRGVTGVALVDGALATVECRTHAVHPAGDHSLIVGEVVAVGAPAEAAPALVHFRGTYAALA
jgi:flavin reductase (DIM6/NTAB) family NADH-FMN oxidoreductase RutF